jgi:hypothetical protein
MAQEPPLPEYLQEQLDEVEEKAAVEERKNPRFDRQKGALIGLFCVGFGLTLGIAMRAGLRNALIFAVFTGLVGFVTGGCQRPKKR